jgi:hypothetical protein
MKLAPAPIRIPLTLRTVAAPEPLAPATVSSNDSATDPVGTAGRAGAAGPTTGNVGATAVSAAVGADR